MPGLTFSRLCTFIFLVMELLSTLSEARAMPEKLPSAVVVGTVYCDTCFHQDFSKSSHFIAGASVLVECADKHGSRRSSFREFAKTDERGEFKVQLPMSVSKHVKKIKGCSVKLINSSEPHCSVASSAPAASSSIHLKARKDGAHIFSAGFFTFKPLSRPELCDQNPTTVDKRTIASISDPNDPSFYPPIQDLPPMGQTFLPPLPELPPLPRLPPLPALPGLPGVVNVNLPGGPQEEKIAGPDIFNPIPLPPIPFLPPPSLLPPFPNPLQPPPSLIPPVIPTPPSSIFPPLFPSPPPSVFPPILPSPPSNPPAFPFPPLIPIPGLTPSPPPPSRPAFPIPLPPFPFQPVPGFPGTPPAPH